MKFLKKLGCSRSDLIILMSPVSCLIYSEGWTLSGAPLDLRDPRILAMAAERHFLEAEYDEYADTNASGAAFCRSAALIVSHNGLVCHVIWRCITL